MKYLQRRSYVAGAGVVIIIVAMVTAFASAQHATSTPSDYVELQFTEIRGLSASAGYPHGRVFITLFDEETALAHQAQSIRDALVCYVNR